MQHYVLQHEAPHDEGDLALADGGQLASAVYLSLFTDARAGDDTLAADDRRGWWADASCGSRIWTALDAGKAVTETLRQVEQAAKDSLGWMVEDGVAERVAATAERMSQQALLLTVTITGPGDVAPRWSWAWEMPMA